LILLAIEPRPPSPQPITKPTEFSQLELPLKSHKNINSHNCKNKSVVRSLVFTELGLRFFDKIAGETQAAEG
jgi:hypothetical protein